MEGQLLQEEGQKEGKGLPLSSVRLKKKEFENIIKNGRKKFSDSLIVYFLKGERDGFGISISKKIGKSVVRNKIKRRLREIYRTNKEIIPKNMQIVVVVKNSAISLEYKKLEDLFLSLVK
ncbi:TPA: ribonuclease P protein component [bacterium]|nr:ribonuclease P protein component [bacterium]